MVRLENIVIGDVSAWCDIYPEDCTQPGRIGIDVENGELLEYSLPTGYEWCRNHVNHARRALIKAVKAEKMPVQMLAMWY